MMANLQGFIILTMGFVCSQLSGRGLYTTDKKKDAIPMVIVQTYYNKSVIPQKVFNNIKEFAEGYKHIIFDDVEVVHFLSKHYDWKVVDTFQKMTGAHKADLFRYAYLYVKGGVYLDIKTSLILPIEEVIPLSDSVYTVLSIHQGVIYDGFIASPPGNPLFLSLVHFQVGHATHTSNVSDAEVDRFYDVLTVRYQPHKNGKVDLLRYFRDQYEFYHLLSKERSALHLQTGAFVSSDVAKRNYFLFSERCTREAKDCPDGLDRYGHCCYIYNDTHKVVKTRYSDFPWK